METVIALKNLNSLVKSEKFAFVCEVQETWQRCTSYNIVKHEMKKKFSLGLSCL